VERYSDTYRPPPDLTTFITAAYIEAADIQIRTIDGHYIQSRRKELDGLFERSALEIVTVPPGGTFFKSRFVDEIRHAGTDQAFEKSRLVVQGYGDDAKYQILTQAPTIQRVSQRILLALAPSFRIAYRMALYLRDILQAYVQSTSNLNRDVYIYLPKDLQLPSDLVFCVA
jgi:hypothetical protein